MTREKLGSIWTDVSTLLIGDPCRLLPVAGQRPLFTYRQIMNLWRFMGKENYSARMVVPHKGIAVDVETDGYYPVFLVRNSRGEPVRLEIQLGGQVEP